MAPDHNRCRSLRTTARGVGCDANAKHLVGGQAEWVANDRTLNSQYMLMDEQVAKERKDDMRFLAPIQAECLTQVRRQPAHGTSAM